MDILFNECSFEAQFQSKEDFSQKTLHDLIPLMEIAKNNGCVLLKNDYLTNAPISASLKLSDFLINPPSLYRNEARYFLIFLRDHNTELYWENTCKQEDVPYDYKEKNMWGTSIAEAVEREQVIISIVPSAFSETLLTIYKNKIPVVLLNCTNKAHLLEYLYINKKIEFGYFLKNFFDKQKINFDKCINISASNVFQLEEEKIFINCFKNFVSTSWEQIYKDRGLDYKEYTGSLPSNYNINHKIYKFRASKKMRVHGYRKDDVFNVLFLEIDHKLSNQG